MKIRYTTYSTTDGTGKLWTFNHKTKVLFDSYGIEKDLENATRFLNRSIKNGILKHVWSTDKKGKYI